MIHTKQMEIQNKNKKNALKTCTLLGQFANHKSHPDRLVKKTGKIVAGLLHTIGIIAEKLENSHIRETVLNFTFHYNNQFCPNFHQDLNSS